MKTEIQIRNELKLYSFIILDSIKTKNLDRAVEYLNRMKALMWVLNIKKLEDVIE